MKSLLLIAVTLLAIVACTPAEPPVDPQIAIDAANTQVVYDYISAMSSGDVDAAAEFLADGFYAHGPNIADSASKDESLANWKANWDSVFTKIDYQRITTITQSYDEGRLQGDWVADWATISVDYQNGPPVAFNYHAVFRVEDNKITSSTGFYNVADILTQQGWKLVPPEAEAAE